MTKRGQRHPRRWLLLPALLVAVSLLAGCLSSFPEGFDDDAISEATDQAITMFNERRFEDLNALFREDLREELTAERWEEAFGDIINKNGAFQQFESVVKSGMEDEETGIEYARIQVMANYENGQLVHDLLFDNDSWLISYRLGLMEE